jgi:hypothetical protein
MELEWAGLPPRPLKCRRMIGNRKKGERPFEDGSSFGIQYQGKAEITGQTSL